MGQFYLPMRLAVVNLTKGGMPVLRYCIRMVAKNAGTEGRSLTFSAWFGD